MKWWQKALRILWRVLSRAEDEGLINQDHSLDASTTSGPRFEQPYQPGPQIGRADPTRPGRRR